MSSADGLVFEAPGPGTWERDPVHFPRPVSRYWADTHPPAFVAGTTAMFGYYGLLLGAMESTYPNGFAYNQRRPAAEADIPGRFARAEEALAAKAWRAQLREWDEEAKPTAIATHREIQAVDPDGLSDDDLAGYLVRCRDHHRAMITQHMRFTASAVIPVGDLMVHLMQWAPGVPQAEVLGLMRGASPVSAGASDELANLVAAFSANADARAVLDADGDPAEILAALRARDDAEGEALDAYLELVGYRLLDGFDIAGRYALELPDALVRSIRSAVAGRAEDDDLDARITAIRDRVPEEHRAEFDELLAEARLMYRLRDERGVFSDIWASGLMRRAAMAAGRRLAERGRIQDPQHIVEATGEEMAAMVDGSGGPTAEELAERFALRSSLTGREGPPFIGDPPTPPPDMSGLPPAEGRLMAAMMVAMGALFGSSEAEHEENRLRGLAASGGVYDGIARRIAGPEEFDRIQQGDVLVTGSTSEAFNILLPLLGAIVTDAGGLLSHSAIVAREYGIPGVVGTRDATQLIADGAHVRVDGDAGEVTVFGVISVVPLADARDESQYGAKAVGLGEATRAGLPIPPGVALSGDMVDAIVDGGAEALEQVMVLVRDLPTPLAVRSSAADEDGADASFAGQHLTLLNVRTADDLRAALDEVWWSANSDSAITYRQRVGLFARPSIGVVVQSLLAPDSAGVMFTRNPVNGADERMIEASWGLGEVVVAARVIPDSFRLARDGAVLDRRPGRKDVALRPRPEGGTEEVAVAAALVEHPCLDAAQLALLNDLATRCESLYGPGRDIEWAFAGGQLYLLQCRAITRAGASASKVSQPPVEGPPAVVTSVPFFAGLSDDEIERISRRFHTRTFPAGETITKEGAGGAAFFVIESGEAVVTVHGQEVARFGRGDYFGEIALIDDGARTATVTAVTDVVCHGITYWEFRPLVQGNATIAWNLLQTLAKRLRTVQE